MSGVFFNGIAQEPISFHGYTARAPLFFRDMRMVAAVFTADLGRVRALMPDARYDPLAILPGRALLAIHAMQYRDTDVGPYDEVSVSVGVTMGRAARIGAFAAVAALRANNYHAHIVRLPVTTDAALHGGIDVFGYPKVMARIDFATAAGRRRCVWREPASGETILTLDVPALPTRRVAQDRRDALAVMDLHSYPVKDGRTLHAHMRVNRIEFAERLLPGSVTVEPGSGDAAAWLRELGIGRCVHVLDAPRCEAILFRPEPYDAPGAPG
ncbi:MAG: acetoacetate decarboxylase family protein [Deltaproteobacteria bacterium]|nr:acetoacetate decarboxylase family protein [Deltaproteobacteria bacterium]